MENNGGAAVTAPISFGYRSTASLRLLLLPPLPSSTADIAAASVCCRRLLRLLRLLLLRLLPLLLPLLLLCAAGVLRRPAPAQHCLVAGASPTYLPVQPSGLFLVVLALGFLGARYRSACSFTTTSSIATRRIPAASSSAFTAARATGPCAIAVTHLAAASTAAATAASVIRHQRCPLVLSAHCHSEGVAKSY
jgi:hypothetical protein